MKSPIGKNGKSRTGKSPTGIALAVLMAFGAGVLGTSDAPWLETLKSTTFLTSPAHAQTAPAMTQALAPVNIADVVQRVGPAVVTIHVTQKVDAGPQAGLPDGTPFDEFFRRFFEGQPGGVPPQFRGERVPREKSAPQQRKVVALGSGFIIDKSGKIVTNNHVVEDADEISVELSDGRKMKAELIGRDEKTDLALLKVAAKDDLPTIAFGDSDPVRVGEWVVALGNPFGVGQTATAGIISAHHRNIGAGPYDDFLQLDASINRGNSGGPTVNLKGEVIGINTAIFSPSGGSVGIGFAIPSNLAKQIIASLADSGTVERGWLGVQIQEVTEEIADSLNLKEPKGALVSKVEPNSPAAAAKLLPGDVITAVNGMAIGSVRDLPRVVANLKSGESGKFVVWREGKEQSMSVKIGKVPSVQEMAKARTNDGGVAGMQLGALNPQQRQKLGLPEGGVVVTNVAPNSPAAESGLDQGDVIVQVGRQLVSTPEEVATQIAAAQKAQTKTILLRVLNERGTQFVPLQLGKA